MARSEGTSHGARLADESGWQRNVTLYTGDGDNKASRAIVGERSITLDGKPVNLADFVPFERRDLEMRGLVGYLPLQGLAPGRHDLHLVWHAQGESTGPDRRREYRIPFWYTPDDSKD